MKAAIIIVAGILAASAAQASMVEELAAPVCPTVGTPLGPCVYQSDFGAPGDAPGAQPGQCVPSDRALPFNQHRSALMAPIDDEADNVHLNIAASQVGRFITVVLTPAPIPGLLDLVALRVFTPGCGGEVPGGGGTVVRFQPQFPGPYVVHAGLRDLLPAPLAGGAEPGADACHPFCAGALNPAAGYDLFASG